MDENKIVKKIEDKMSNILIALKNDFENEYSINWMETPGSYKTEIDCAVNIALSFKNLQNEIDEGLNLEVNISKSNLESVKIITVSLTRSNGAAIELEEIMYDYNENSVLKEGKLDQIYIILNKFYQKMLTVIRSEYLI